MYEYKVFKWKFDLSSAEDLESELNVHGKQGWKVINIISNMSGSVSAFGGSVDQNTATFILEKVK